MAGAERLEVPGRARVRVVIFNFKNYFYLKCMYVRIHVRSKARIRTTRVRVRYGRVLVPDHDRSRDDL